MPDGPRFAFHPLERRGLLLGLDASQLLTIAAGAVAAVVAHALLRGPLGVFVGLAMATGGLAAAVWTRDGASLAARAVIGVRWLLRRPSAPLLDDRPRSGQSMGGSGAVTARHASGPRRPGRSHPTAPAGIELLSDHGLPGDEPLGVIRDHRSGCWAAVVPVRGCSFSLMEPAEQLHRLEGWRQALGVAARSGSPVARLQWLERSWAGAAGAPGSEPSPSDPGSYPEHNPVALASYHRMAEAVDRTMLHHHAWIVLAVRPSQRQMGRAGSAVAELRREIRLLSGQLREAGLDPLPPLDLRAATALIGGRGRPPVGRSGRPPLDDTDAAWPMASSDDWSAYRADGAWHATYWIAEWPRVHVGPDFLTPLLLGAAWTTVSVVMAPVPADQAMREVRSARTADLADAELKSRAGFLQSARRARESEGVTRRETELADGHHEFRFSGYVTVSAPDPERLAAACAVTEHSAQAARLELRRLYGRQAEAYTWTLPLGRGLR